MKSRYLIAAYALTSLFWTASASAQAILTSDVTSIVVGQSITYNVVLPYSPGPFPVYVPGQDLFFRTLSDGQAFFFSGDGQTELASVSTFGGGNVSFTYLTPGDYTARVSGLLVTTAYECSDLLHGCVSLLSGGGINFDATENITVSVPEPSTWAMILLGFAGLGFAAYRRTRKPVLAAA